MVPEENIQAHKLTQHNKQHQEHSVHCGLWVQQLASWKSLKNKSVVIDYLQWKKYASFAKL
jgi:hypothetical protein